MEGAFGHDFSRVRVHSNADAATLTSNLNARAFTVGSDIGFAEGDDLHYVEDREGIHRESSWAKRLPDALRFLLANAQNQQSAEGDKQ